MNFASRTSVPVSLLCRQLVALVMAATPFDVNTEFCFCLRAFLFRDRCRQHVMECKVFERPTFTSVFRKTLISNGPTYPPSQACNCDLRHPMIPSDGVHPLLEGTGQPLSYSSPPCHTDGRSVTSGRYISFGETAT